MIARIYAEGGGVGQLYDTLFRRSWQEFFKAAGLSGRMPSVVRGTGREQTFDLFLTAVKNPRSNVLPVLLVDSESPVTKGHTAWQHLSVEDGWTRPPEASENQAYLMVQVMETWFLADLPLLRRYFGEAFRENVLRSWPDLEDLSKNAVWAVLRDSTAACRIRYAKGRVSFDLLAKVNPSLVEAACPHANAFLNFLRGL